VELADSSAWTTRHRDTRVRSDFDALVRAGRISTCDPVEFELLWTARSADEFASMRADFARGSRIRTLPEDWDRAAGVWNQLVRRGGHRQIPRFDLLVAAVAERAGWPVLHYDRHFEVIAEVTGQPLRAIAPLGSLG
jgi:predicted nucleic acid-binding protein